MTDGDDNLNKIVTARKGQDGKRGHAGRIQEGGLFSKYLFGEIRADFLDDSEQPDIATSSRQDIFEEDERYKALKDFCGTS
ncbi:MAG: hypothetical protein IPM82_08045 [Saprospiraceae bacterium]|nr:hypothetical protein [Saprospiraceae bacterium]